MALLLLLGGCTVVDTSKPTGDASYHFGLVKVVSGSPGEQTKVESNSVQTLGIRVQDGFALGYFDEKRLKVPLDCRLVMIVRTEKQMQQAKEILQTLKGDKLCIAQEQD
ncbi:MAG: hypothetical protein HXY26_06205 [Hydrogenophilaceae bacterium]|nr:hypothetical protein [Hydrogenophilaceae bacterium]